jgi:O-glycosyl hydrolase
VRQPIYGFGGSQTYNGDLLAGFANREAVYRALFADLNLDILRLRNYYNYDGLEDNFEAKTREFAMAARRWSDPQKRAGKGPVRLMFTSWSPPASLKSNRLVSGRSDGTDKGLENATLRRNPDGRYAYGEFADWWLASLQKFKELTGGYPDYIALQNELDLSVPYEGCRFLPGEGTGEHGYSFAGYDQALAAVSDRLTGALGAQTPKILGPETFTIRREPDHKSHVQNYVDPTTASGRAVLARLFGISFHIYGSGAEAPDPGEFHTLLNTLRQTYRTDGAGKPLFQTEFLEGPSLTSVAGMIHDTLTIGGASAYLVWISARSVSQPGYALVYYNPYDGSVERRERFYAVKHFSAFVGEGYHRIETDCSDPALKLSAYIGPGGDRLVAVLINPTGQERRVTLVPDSEPFRNAATNLYRSSEGESGERWRDLGTLGPDHLITLPPRSVATVTFDRRTTAP